MSPLKLDSRQELAKAACVCAEALQKPRTVALVPTETVYGLVCAWKDSDARSKIYSLKKRAESKPLAAFLPDIESATLCVPSLPLAARRLAEAFCPGPITIVVPDGGGSTFGFRMPDHPFVQALLEAFGAPLASTSANLSGEPAALCAASALASLDSLPDIVVDGGPLPGGSVASTVVEVSDSGWRMLRPGPVSAESIAAVLAL